jgi:hypothetical protein
MRSCSSGGRDESWEKTLWSARVMGEAYRPGDCRTSRCSRQSRRRDIGVESRCRLGGGLAAERQGVDGRADTGRC